MNPEFIFISAGRAKIKIRCLCGKEQEVRSGRWRRSGKVTCPKCERDHYHNQLSMACPPNGMIGGEYRDAA